MTGVGCAVLSGSASFKWVGKQLNGEIYVPLQQSYLEFFAVVVNLFITQ